MFFRMMVSAAAILAASSAWAGDQLLLGPASDWVKTAELGSPGATETSEVGYRYRLYDAQTRFEDGLRHSYVRYRILIQSPEGLGSGGVITLDWSRDHEDLTVHHVRVIRQGEVIEVLNSQQFEILRRETSFEESTVAGLFTAALHPADLRVGDELEVAFTLSRREPVAGARPEALLNGGLTSNVETLRVAASWPDSLNIQMRATDGWTVPAPRRRNGYNEVVVEMKDVEPYFVPNDAPRRFFQARQAQLSSYAGWNDVVSVLTPFYSQASTLGENSPLLAEIEGIRAAHSTQQAQALAALRLVEDKVRYLAILIGEGGWVPTSADEVWRLRQGDCKGKTVLLLALLRGLGIEADAALVSTRMGDALAEGLPRMHAFDHVVVRAEIDGLTYWLDGTRTGDRALERSAFAPYQHALVLADGRTGLDAIDPIPRETPDTEFIEVVDGSAGLFALAKLTMTTLMRGENGRRAAEAMQRMGPAARQQQFDQIVEEMELLKDGTVTTAYDDSLGAFSITITGSTEGGILSYGTMDPFSLRLSADKLSERKTPYLPTVPHVVAYPLASAGRIDYALPEGGHYEVTGGGTQFDGLAVRYRREVNVDGARVTGRASAASFGYEVTHEAFERSRLAVDPRLSEQVHISVAGIYQPTAADREAWANEERETDVSKKAELFEARVRELTALGLYEEAERAASRGVELMPGEAGAWAARASLRLVTGDFDGAEADLDRAEELDPANETLAYGRVRLTQGRGDTREYILANTRLLRMSPGDSDVLEWRAGAYLSAGLGDRALADMDAAINAADDASKARIKARKARALGRIGRTDEAETLSRTLLEEAPDDIGVMAERIDWLVSQKRHEDALALTHRLLARDQSETYSFAKTAIAGLAAGGETDRALELARALVARAETHSGYLNEGCWNLVLAGVGLDQAEAWCEAARKTNPLSPEIADSLARVRLQQGRYDEALKEYDYALTRQAVMPAARYGRGLALIALGREDEGRADVDLAKRQSAYVDASFRSYEGAR